jgi:tetratricopeptide (TPR) repeat protein
VKLFSFLKKTKKVEKTLDDYLQIAKSEPENTGVHMKIADLYLKKGKKGEAIKEYIYAAETYAKEELYQLTMSIYKTVLTIDPTLVAVYVTLSELYQKQGFVGDAAATYEKLAQHYLKEKKNEEAESIVEKMVSLDPSNQFIRNKADKFLSRLKGGAPAEEMEAPEKVPAKKRRQEEEIRIASPEEILEEKDDFFDLGAQLDDEQELAVADEVEEGADATSMEVDKVFEGIKHDIGEKTEEESHRLHYELGIAYQQMERIDEAIEEFKKALSEQEVKNDCFLRLCACFREKEMYKHAVNAAKSGLKNRFISQNEFLGLHYELGVTYAEMGENKKALEVFKEIGKVDTNYKDTNSILKELKGS